MTTKITCKVLSSNVICEGSKEEESEQTEIIRLLRLSGAETDNTLSKIMNP